MINSLFELVFLTQSRLSKYHLTVLYIPVSKVSIGSQFNSFWIFLESIAYLLSWPGRSSTKFIKSEYFFNEILEIGFNLSNISHISLTTYKLVFSLLPPIL